MVWDADDDNDNDVDDDGRDKLTHLISNAITVLEVNVAKHM